MSIRVLLADDHRMVREGLRSLLKHEADVAVVGEAEEGRTAVRMASELQPDVVVMDVSMPDLNGIDATRQVLAACPSTRVVALSAGSDHRAVAEMLRAGATGYVVKDAAFEELAVAIRTVVGGQVYLSPAVAGTVVDGYARGGAAGPKSVFEKLSGREREILQLMAEGRATKQIATDLRVSVKTVETHRRNLMEKLEIDSVAELTKYAIREGITSV
jgi:DNA-binding NarL/FixJ family response regulator